MTFELPPTPPERFRKLPYPIVHTFEAMWAIDGSGDWAWNLRLRRLIKCFATALQYVTILGLNDYLLQREARPNPKLDAFLVHQLRKPSLGHWARLFASTSKHLGRQLFVPELLEFHGKGRTRTFPQHLIELRNRYVHPDIFPPEDEARRVLGQHYPTLETFLDDLSFLADYPLLGCQEETCLHCHGAEPTPAGTELEAYRRALASGSFGVVGHEGQLMPLSLFLWLRPAAQGSGEPYLYGHVERHGVVYILGDSICFEASKYDEFSTILDTLTEDEERRTMREERQRRERHHEAPCWRHVWTQGALRSHERIQQEIDARRYHKALYVERADAKSEIEAFLGSDRRMALVVGGSGYGKTSFVADLARGLLPAAFTPDRARRLARGQDVVALNALEEHPDLVLHYRAAAIPHVDMGRLLADDLRLVPERLAAYLDVLSGQRVGRLAGMNILLIFDGVNEHPQARQLCEAVRDFARTCSHPWIKILVCLRSAYWEYVRDVFMADPTGLWVHRDELGATRPYVQIDQFTPGEVARAHDLYLHNRKRWKLRIQGDWEHVPETVREILRDPYLLRQYAKNYRFPPDGLVPATILMDSFGSLVPGHRAFLVRLLTLMWSRGTDILDREALGSDPKLMEYYREEPYTNGYLTRCPVHPDQGGEFLLEVPTEPPCCPSCDRRFELDPTERRNTIDALIDQGIIAVSRRDEADATVRFAHDRIFEAVSAVFLSVSHDAERLGPEQRAARLGPSLEHAQLRNALVLYQLITARYSIEDDNGVPITSPERMYLDSERLRFDERDSTLQHWNEVHAMLEHLLERDDPRLASFLVKSMAQLPKGGEWVERIFDEEKTRPPSAPLGLSFQIAAQAARELGLTGQLLGVLSWGRPFHADFALEYLFHLASGSVEQDGGAFATVLTYLRRELRGIRGLWRHRLAIKPLLELMLRIASVHVDKPAVMTTLGTLLVELLGSLPLVGRRGPRWLQPLAWLATRVLLVPASFVVVPWIKEKVEESSEKSTFLAGASAERILTLGPDDPAKIRLCLSNLGNKEPSGDPLWDLLREFDTPDRERTTVPSVKTSLCSAMELSRLLCEGESVLPRLHAHLDHVEAAHSRLTMLNLLGYYAIIQREVSADLLSLARRISTELHGRFWAEARRCRSFAGLENYPLFQLGIVEKAAGHSSMGGLQEAARRAIAQQDADTLVYAWKNMLPAAVRWPEETLGFLAATVDFQPDHILLRGTEWKLPRPTGSAPARVLPEDPLGPLRELISALNLVHRRALEGFLDRQEVDSEWRSFLLSEQRHERLRRFQTTKTTTRFVNMQLNDPESGLFREWARKVFDVWLDHAEATGFRPLGRRGLVRLTFGLLRIAQELVHSRLPR